MIAIIRLHAKSNTIKQYDYFVYSGKDAKFTKELNNAIEDLYGSDTVIDQALKTPKEDACRSILYYAAAALRGGITINTVEPHKTVKVFKKKRVSKADNLKFVIPLYVNTLDFTGLHLEERRKYR